MRKRYFSPRRMHLENETPISPMSFASRRSNKKRFEFGFKREINQDRRRNYSYSFREWSLDAKSKTSYALITTQMKKKRVKPVSKILSFLHFRLL
jgi:hypothetical protein